ncbi:MAG: GNAT family N-acetyltransferase [Burkholderiales bacterium]|nr:MAG: GNAT family N-acetyltransferase [Burkholderiales bacterium]
MRPIRQDDVALEADFVRNLSDESRYKRFMASMRELPQVKLDSLTAADQVRDVALAATVTREGRPVIVGVARYSVGPEHSGCEFAVAVDDAWQGTGLAGILMHALMGIARDRGLSTIEGIVLTTNSRMLKLARQLGFRRLPDPGSRDTVRVVRSLQSPP